MVQWLKLCASTVGGAGSIPGWGTKIPHALWYSQKTNKLKKKKKISLKKKNNKEHVKDRGEAV